MESFIQASKFSDVFQFIDCLAASNGNEFEKNVMTFKVQNQH